MINEIENVNNWNNSDKINEIIKAVNSLTLVLSALTEQTNKLTSDAATEFNNINRTIGLIQHELGDCL